MFRMLSPWDEWGWASHADDDDIPFAGPSRPSRISAPVEDFMFDHPAAYGYPAYRTRQPRAPPMGFYSGYQRQPRRQDFFPSPAPPSDLYGAMPDDPYGLNRYPFRVPSAREPVFYPAAPRTAFPVSVVAQPPNANDDKEFSVDEEDKHITPMLTHNGNGYVLNRPRAPQRQQQQPKPAPNPRAANTFNAPVGSKTKASESGSGSDGDSDAGRRSQPQPQPLLYFDPMTGLCFRAMPAAAPTANVAKKSAVASASSASASAAAAAATPNERPQDEVAAKKTFEPHLEAAEAPAGAASPPRSTTPRRPRPGSLAAATSGNSGGPTRIAVRMAEGPGSSSVRLVPVVSSGSAAAATSAPSSFAFSSLERQPSSALVTRPPMEVALSRGPSVVLPSAAAAMITAATEASATSAPAPPSAAVTGGKAAAASSNGSSSSSGRKIDIVAAGSAPRMTRSQAARTVQRWWRGWRLWRHGAALRQLTLLAGELRAAASRFYAYLGATDGNLTSRQQLEINELAMRAILRLDSLEGLPPELRVLRKHLTARAIRLQDEVHNAYARSATRPAAQQQQQPAPEAAPAAATAKAPVADSAKSSPAGGANSDTAAAAAEPEEVAVDLPAALPVVHPPSTSTFGMDDGADAATVNGGGSDSAVLAAGADLAAYSPGEPAPSVPAPAEPPQQELSQQELSRLPGQQGSGSPTDVYDTLVPVPANATTHPQVHIHLHVGRRPRRPARCRNPKGRPATAKPTVPVKLNAVTAEAMAAAWGRQLRKGILKQSAARRAPANGDICFAVDAPAGACKGRAEGLKLRRLQRSLSAAAAATVAGGRAQGSAGRSSASGGSRREHLQRKLQQQPVTLRVVLPAACDGATDGCRTAVLVDAGVQTD